MIYVWNLWSWILKVWRKKWILLMDFIYFIWHILLKLFQVYNNYFFTQEFLLKCNRALAILIFIHHFNTSSTPPPPQPLGPALSTWWEQSWSKWWWEALHCGYWVLRGCSTHSVQREKRVGPSGSGRHHTMAAGCSRATVLTLPDVRGGQGAISSPAAPRHLHSP